MGEVKSVKSLRNKMQEYIKTIAKDKQALYLYLEHSIAVESYLQDKYGCPFRGASELAIFTLYIKYKILQSPEEGTIILPQELIYSVAELLFLPLVLAIFCT